MNVVFWYNFITMTINWYGQSCFRIEVPIRGTRIGDPRSASPIGTKGGVSILIDPFSKEIGLRPARIKDDLVLITHEHYDHNNLEGLNPEAFLINAPGEYEKMGIYIQGISSYHDNTEGKERGLNTIYIIKAEDMVVCHMGDFGQTALGDKQIEDIGDIDVLMIPVGGKYTIDYKEAVEAISQIEPKIVIPMHYKTSGLKIDIDGPEKFVKELGLTPEKVDKFKINKKSLPTEETKLVMFTI